MEPHAGAFFAFVASAMPDRRLQGSQPRRSLRARAAYRQRAEHGVAYDRALRQRIVDDMGMGGSEL